MSSTAAKAIVVVAFLAIGGVAAAQLGVLNGVVGSDDASALDQVPDGVDSVATVDPAVLEKDVTARLYSAAYDASVGEMNDTRTETDETETPGEDETDETDGFGDEEPMRATSPAEMVPANMTAALDEVENQSGLDPRAADQIVLFQQQRNYSQPDYAAAVIHADWETSEVVTLVENDTDETYVNTTVDGVTVYQPVENESENETESFGFGAPQPERWVALHDDGQYVIGTEPAVNDTSDVAAGEADHVDGDLRSAFAETEDGFLRYAQQSQNVNVTRINQTMGRTTGLNVTAYAEAYNDLHVTAGSYYLTEDGFGYQSRILTNSTDTAEDVQSLVEGFISINAGAIQNETIEDQLRSTNVTREDTTVTVTRETSTDTAVKIIRWYAEIFTGGQSTGMGATGVA